MKKEQSILNYLFVFSRLYLQSADMHRKESLNLLKMAHRMDAIASQIKSNEQNKQVIPFPCENILDDNSTQEPYTYAPKAS